MKSKGRTIEKVRQDEGDAEKGVMWKTMVFLYYFPVSYRPTGFHIVSCLIKHLIFGLQQDEKREREGVKALSQNRWEDRGKRGVIGIS